MSAERKRSPRIACAVLRLVLKKGEFHEKSGDLEEAYSILADEMGELHASLWYWAQIVKALPVFFVNSLYWNFLLFKNYIKITLRNLRKHCGFSFINLAGLTLGLTAFILILFYIRFEFSYDRFHENAGAIYKVYTERHNIFWRGKDKYNQTPPILAPTLERDFPEIVRAVRVLKSEEIVGYAGTAFNEKNIYFVDPGFFDMFTFPLLKGEGGTALDDPTSILLTEETSRKYFGDRDPLGEIITLNGEYDYTVRGVLKNVPANSHMHFDFVLPFLAYFIDWSTTYDQNNWGNFMGVKTYVQFPENFDIAIFGAKLRSYTDTYLDGVFAGETRIFHVMPMLKIHLHGHFVGELEPNGDVRYVYIFSIVATLILLIACFNYINLSTAQSSVRAAEVGLRKVIGANKKSLIMQFLGESLVLTTIATALAVGAVPLLLPAMNSLIGCEMSFDVFRKSDYAFLLAIPLFTAMLAGTYPALYLSSFQTAKTLKNALASSGNKRGSMRSTLVIVQFSIAIAMIVSTVAVARQMNFIKNRDLGFAHSNILMIPLPDDQEAHYTIYKQELLSHHLITAATIAQSPIHPSSFAVADWEGKSSDELVKIYLGNIDYDYLDFYDLEIVRGRNFSRTMPTDSAAFILNEKAVETYGIEDPIGKRFSAWTFEGPIIGIIKDYHFTSLQLPIEPLALSIAINPVGILAIKASGGYENLAEVVAYSETVFNKVFPGIPFEYTFLDEEIGAMYNAERKLGVLFNLFTFFAIGISCLGLYGLVIFLVRRKTKEIGIRKVLGASAARITFLLTAELLKWITVAAMIGAPIAWILMHGWLRNYAYRVPLSLDIFVIAVGSVLAIALLTMSYNSLRSALANPVDSLRDE